MQFLTVTDCTVTTGLQMVNLSVAPLFISSVLHLYCVKDPSESLVELTDPFSEQNAFIFIKSSEIY
jgi:hypothetical protein